MYKKAKSDYDVLKDMQAVKKRILNVKVKKFKKISIREFINKF